MSALLYLHKLCAHWGGKLRLMTPAEWSDVCWDRDRFVCESPASPGHGIDWPRRVVLADSTRVNPGALIHEMGHVFLSVAHPSGWADQGEVEEYVWLGWEVVMARRAGCYSAWSAQNTGYAVGDDKKWGDLDTLDLRALCTERIAYARSIGIVDMKHHPVSTRLP